jgi:limonene 1,2-monooxygenase
MVANRIIQLDHMTMGRVMFGAGPGLLPTDASMVGVEVKRQRDMMVEALEVILRLFQGEEVTAETSWFKLHKARVHLLPYSHPYPEIAVASAFTPSGGMLAGKHGLSMLCVAASMTFGFNALASNWKIANQIAQQHGRTMDPGRLRLMGLMHLAETRERARENVRAGLESWCRYTDKLTPQDRGDRDWLDFLVERFGAVIGTPEDAIAQIERLQAEQGDFGVFLTQATNWADWEATKKSYELYARFVMPHFARTNLNRKLSYDNLAADMVPLRVERKAGADAAFAKWEHEKKNLRG